MKQLVCITSYFLGCPVHDGVGEPELRFFNDIEEFEKYVLENFKDIYIKDLFGFDGKVVAEVKYSNTNHSVDFVDIENNESNIIKRTSMSPTGVRYLEEIGNCFGDDFQYSP